MSANFKSFVTEEEVSEQRQKRQAEWERVRKEDDPEECPEEETRSLFAQLEANKSAKDKDFEDESRLRSSVKGLDDEEAQFLNFVSNRQVQIERERTKEEKTLLKEMEAARVIKATEKAKGQDGGDSGAKPASSSASGSRKSQSQILSGAIKRKSSNTDQEAKKAKPEDTSNDKTNKKGDNSDVKMMAGLPHNNGLAVVAGVLPGISGYDDDDSSTENDSRSSDSEDDHRVYPSATTLRVLQDMVKKMKGDCG